MKFINATEKVMDSKGRSYIQHGNPKGDIIEREEFLRYLIRNKKHDEDNLFREFVDNIPWTITRKYMRKFCSYKRKDRRINTILKMSGYKEEEILGKAYGKQTILTIEEFNKKQLELKSSTDLLWKKIEELKQKDIQRQAECEKIEKDKEEQWKKDYIISMNCMVCGNEMKFPTLNNIENNKVEQFVHSIYKKSWNDISDGIKLCYVCELQSNKYDNWIKAKIVKDIEDVQKQIQENPKALEMVNQHGFVKVEIDVVEFCQKNRCDGKMKNSYIVRKVLNEICKEMGITNISFEYYNEPISVPKKVEERQESVSYDITEYENVEVSDEEKYRYETVKTGDMEKIIQAMERSLRRSEKYIRRHSIEIGPGFIYTTA